MATEICRKCGSPMEVKRNGKNGFFAGCSTPEKHDGGTPSAADLDAVAAEHKAKNDTSTEPIPQPKSSGFLDSWF